MDIVWLMSEYRGREGDRVWLMGTSIGRGLDVAYQ